MAGRNVVFYGDSGTWRQRCDDGNKYANQVATALGVSVPRVSSRRFRFSYNAARRVIQTLEEEYGANLRFRAWLDLLPTVGQTPH